MASAGSIVGSLRHGAARTNAGRYTFFDEVKVNVGGHLYSFNDIEQGLIRGNKPAPYHVFPVFGRGDPRIAFVVSRGPGAVDGVASKRSGSVPDPRVHFALNCGAKSCPPIKTFTAEALDEELRLAATVRRGRPRSFKKERKNSLTVESPRGSVLSPPLPTQTLNL